MKSALIFLLALGLSGCAVFKFDTFEFEGTSDEYVPLYQSSDYCPIKFQCPAGESYPAVGNSAIATFNFTY